MKVLAEIYRTKGLQVRGKIFHRAAVRAVIFRRNELLMVYSSSVGDYKFPGGGVNMGEPHVDALARELLEECGATLIGIDGELGTIIEYDNTTNTGYDLFKMTSTYYFCRVEDGFINQNLDEYEKDLGFQPVWIDIKDAIKTNKQLLSLNKPPEWLQREIFALEYIQKSLRKTKN